MHLQIVNFCKQPLIQQDHGQVEVGVFRFGGRERERES